MKIDDMKQILSDIVCVSEDEIKMESLLKEDLGADSLDLYDLYSIIEKRFQIKIVSKDLDSLNTVSDVINLVNARGR